MNELQKLIVWTGRLVPLSVRERIIGDGYRPSWISTAIHSVLNRASGEKYPILDCGGLLTGYRMKLEWARFRCFSYGSWEPELVALVAKKIQPGFRVVDIGAHIGYYTLLLSRLVGANGRVYSFEPVPTNFEFLSENVRLNDCANVEPINRAVVDVQQQIHFDIRQGDPLPIDVCFADSNSRGDLVVEGVSLDEYFLPRAGRIDFLKVDAESAEDKVLDGAHGLIARDHPSILMEVHHFDGNLESRVTPAKLRELGYRVEHLDRGPLNSHFWAEWPEPS
jgi:FkbM family methyltransferase